MRIHRTTARGALLLSLFLALSLAVASASLGVNEPNDPPGNGKKPIIFPVVGAAKYFDDWGDPRGQGRHAGNDILTTWRSPAVAAEDGKIRLHTTSSRAGCMLYLYGASGTTYLYIHLEQRPHRQAGQQRLLRSGDRLCERPEDGLAGEGRSADRVQR